MSSSGKAVDLIDLILIAESTLRVPADEIRRVLDIALAESALAAPHASFGGVEFYPDPVDRAAILCSRIVRNHALPDGNKRVAFVCMVEQLHRYGWTWPSHAELIDEVVATIEALAAGELDEQAFCRWVKQNAIRA